MSSIVEFCNSCAAGLNKEPDIDIPKIFKELEVDQVKRVHCAGCGIMAVANIGGAAKITKLSFRGRFVDYKIEE